MSLVLSKAEELAEAISVSEELTNLRDAAQRLDGDGIANAALQKFQEKQEVMQRAASTGIELPEEQMNELKNMQSQIRDIPAVQNFAEAQNKFNALISRVNNIIAAAVTGVDPGQSGQESCGPGCGCQH